MRLFVIKPCSIPSPPGVSIEVNWRECEQSNEIVPLAYNTIMLMGSPLHSHFLTVAITYTTKRFAVVHKSGLYAGNYMWVTSAQESKRWRDIELTRKILTIYINIYSTYRDNKSVIILQDARHSNYRNHISLLDFIHLINWTDWSLFRFNSAESHCDNW